MSWVLSILEMDITQSLDCDSSRKKSWTYVIPSKTPVNTVEVVFYLQYH